MGWEPDRYGPTIAALLTPAREASLDAGRADPTIRARLDVDTVALFDRQALHDADAAGGCHAALWLYHDYLPQSHRLSQRLHSADGSYWHGLMHRREGDFGNSKYWFRRVGEHPVFGRLAAALSELRHDDDPAGARDFAADGAWDPAAFVDLCAAAVGGDDSLRPFCRRLQQREWELLFDDCFDRAVGSGF